NLYDVILGTATYNQVNVSPFDTMTADCPPCVNHYVVNNGGNFVLFASAQRCNPGGSGFSSIMGSNDGSYLPISLSTASSMAGGANGDPTVVSIYDIVQVLGGDISYVGGDHFVLQPGTYQIDADFTYRLDAGPGGGADFATVRTFLSTAPLP